MPQLYIAWQRLEGQTGHAAGRQLLAALWRDHIGTNMPPIAIAPGGKPYFTEGNWLFSISHTKGHAFCALSDAPVGIDAEEIGRKIDLRLAQKILSPGEKAQLDASDDPRLTLLSFWVLKEAAAKLTGQGLQGYPNHTNFTLPDSRISEIDGCLVAAMTAR